MQSFNTRIVPPLHKDVRGHFQELYNINTDKHFPTGIKQISTSYSKFGVFRGMHFQYDAPMAKAMRVVTGAVKLIDMDMRPLSPTFGKIQYIWAFEASPVLYYAPAYIARGFQAVTADVRIEYFQDASFNPDTAMTISLSKVDFDNLHISEGVIMSEKDKNGMTLEEWREFAISNKIFVDSLKS
jgi:dTDP-4-dehydrorhamnose 3,5-epimerase